ncbi:PREDICTED: uncharacterized protein LOC109229762 [Nicotiana attenuata]|uniref:uncharacterized protein LOC109229762 n=1 Tax=Nicotiana attenuata TaxID=49451 RepID=UPI0009046628|nr:PREDICTED: uncharacterized protein LOC109229762 [Nicotiana attenuata]
MAAKGMDLSFIAPTIKNGQVIVELSKEEVEEETQKWKQTLILYVVGSTPTIGAMERFIADEVLYSGPHMLNNKPIIMKVWTVDFDFNKEVLQIIPSWVRFPNLPFNCWGAKSLSRISSSLGVPLYADACTTQLDRISYARVLIEVDVTKELPKAVKVTDPNGRVFVQEVTYDWVPAFCTTCMKVGHQCNAGEQKITKDNTRKQKQKQEWQPNVIQKEKGNQQKVEANKDKEIAGYNETQGNNAGPSKEHEHAWKKVTGKSVAKSREKPENGTINMINGFNILAETSLQLAYNRAIDEGTSKQRSNEEVGAGDQNLFFPCMDYIQLNRRRLWNELNGWSNIQQGAWLIMRDYNTIRGQEDRPVGKPVQEAEVRDLNDFMEQNGLTEIRTVGRRFTWTNGHTYSRIDRAIVNVVWML